MRDYFMYMLEHKEV